MEYRNILREELNKLFVKQKKSLITEQGYARFMNKLFADGEKALEGNTAKNLEKYGLKATTFRELGLVLRNLMKDKDHFYGNVSNVYRSISEPQLKSEFLEILKNDLLPGVTNPKILYKNGVPPDVISAMVQRDIKEIESEIGLTTNTTQKKTTNPAGPKITATPKVIRNSKPKTNDWLTALDYVKNTQTVNPKQYTALEQIASQYKDLTFEESRIQILNMLDDIPATILSKNKVVPILQKMFLRLDKEGNVRWGATSLTLGAAILALAYAIRIIKNTVSTGQPDKAVIMSAKKGLKNLYDITFNGDDSTTTNNSQQQAPIKNTSNIIEAITSSGKYNCVINKLTIDGANLMLTVKGVAHAVKWDGTKLTWIVNGEEVIC